MKTPLRQHMATAEEMGITCTHAPTDSTCIEKITVWHLPYQKKYLLEPTHDTTRPLKQGSFALSSDISSFTTL